VLGVVLRILFICAAILLSACSTSVRKSNLNVFTVAVAGNQVLVGESITFGTNGTFSMKSINGEPISCKGKFVYDQLPKGRAKFSCSNGETGNLRIRAEGDLSGTGQGTSSLGPVQIIFGYSLPAVNSKLRFPDSKQLKVVENQYVLDTSS
jgi:hypothetical protein